MPQLSSRNVKGRGWHKKGYREYGQIYFQLKRSYANFSREFSVNENETIARLLDDLHSESSVQRSNKPLRSTLTLCSPGQVSEEDPFPPDHLHFCFYFRKELLEPSDALAKTILDGGETIYAKVCGVPT